MLCSKQGVHTETKLPTARRMRSCEETLAGAEPTLAVGAMARTG